MPDYGQNNVTSQGSSPNAKTLAQFEQFKAMVCGELIDENEALKKENEELKNENQKKDERINELQKINADKDIDIHKLKNKLIEAQNNIRAEENNKSLMDDLVFDLTDFFKDATPQDVKYLLGCLFNLTQIKLKPECYLINKASDIIPIYIVLTRDSKLENTIGQFCGTLKAFCEYWNTNIVPYIQDKERAVSLTCNYDTIKATINKAPWKNVDPISWRRLASESPKKKKIYQQAFNIKERIVNLILDNKRA